ncbi:MAG: DUF2786 domain-containing protein, partial [Ilumatobacter sp.]
MTLSETQHDRTLVERIRKLLDKAERTDSVHEAEAFAAKAAHLVARHRISPEQLAQRGGAADDLAIRELVVGRGAYVRGRIALLGNIAEAHDVRMVFQATPAGSVAFLAGRSEDLDVVEVMYASLHTQVAGQMAGLRRSTGAATQRERRAFLFGYANRIGDLLAESAVAAKVEADRRAGGGAATELAIRERRERVDEFADESWGRVRSATRPARLSPDGYLRGVEAADRADVGR